MDYDYRNIKSKKITYRFIKRLFDIAGAGLLLLALSPLIAVIAALIKIKSPGPVLYKGKRTYDRNGSFQIYKFRTMVVDAEKLGGPSTALNDNRVTRIGAFLRKYKLDELPQLVNILKGEMSFVGPRPQVEKYTQLYKGEELLILDVKPGLTDFASLHFIDMDGTLGTENVDEVYLSKVEPVKNRLRLKYVNEQSFFTDIKILALTIMAVLGFRNQITK